MLKLLRYLHKTTWVLLLAVACICVQVFFELQMPGYMSELVTTGIQLRGMTHAAPEQITRPDAELVASYMTRSEQDLFAESYVPGPGDILELRDVTGPVLEQLDRAFTVSEWTILRLMAELPGAGDDGRAGMEVMPNLSDVNLAAIQEDAAALRSLPSSAVAEARRHALAVSASLAAQTGAAFASAFCSAAGRDAAEIQRSFMLQTGGSMALCAAAAAGASLLVSLAAAKTGAGLARNLRRAVFMKVQSFRRTDFDRFTNASLLARTTNDISLVQSSVISYIRIILFAFCMGLGGVLLAAFSSPVLACILAAAVGAVSLIIWVIFRMTRPRYRIVQNMIDRLNLIAREGVEGAPTIRIFGGEKWEEQRFDKANDKLATTQLGINRVLIFLSPAFGLIINCVSLAIVWLGADAVQRSVLEVGSIVADIQYAGIVLSAGVLIAGMFVTIPRTAVSADRILAVLTLDPDAADADKTVPRNLLPELEAKHVRLTRPRTGRPVLEDVSLRAGAGEVTAVVGLTGCGKTTLLDVLAGAHDPDDGLLFLGGQDLRDLPRAARDDLIAYLPQERQMLVPGLPEDGCLDPDWNPQHTPAFRHKTLNAAELRRRLLASKALLYLLDEPFLGVRPSDRPSLWAELRAAAARGAVLIAASRVSDVQKADRILVLQNGRIETAGTHDDLMRSSELYRELAQAEGEVDE